MVSQNTSANANLAAQEDMIYMTMAMEEDDEEYEPETETDDEDDDYESAQEGQEPDDENDDDDDTAELAVLDRLANGQAAAAIRALRTRRRLIGHIYGFEQLSPEPSRYDDGPSVLMFPVPNVKGEELMVGSDFGSAVSQTQNGKRKRSSRQEYLLKREMGMYRSAGQLKACHQGTVRSYLPESQADFVIENDYHCYIGQFSEDGNFFYSGAQDMCVRLYDTSDPLDWKYYKTVHYLGGQWTITDASLSPDNRLLAYSSITSVVYLADTTPERDNTQRLEFAVGSGPHSMHPRSGIMSVRFSGDGNELIVGAKDKCVYIYDITAGRPILRLKGHVDEVNAVCYGDSSSPHIIYSGSDDSTIKVWDRRSIADGRPVGVFTGHTEGITFVHSKGDGRYVLSNGKDQQMKLWDLRNMMDPGEFQRMPPKSFSTEFDYRNERYCGRGCRHPSDKSLVSYEGHSIHRTLIRCYFSPPLSTGSRYVYTGSADGIVKIFNIDATQASQIDVHTATKVVRPDKSGQRSRYNSLFYRFPRERTCVRDVSWHPSAPVFAATSFQGDSVGKGTVSVHSWRGADKDVDSDDNEEDAEYEREEYTPRVYGTQMEEIREDDEGAY